MMKTEERPPSVAVTVARPAALPPLSGDREGGPSLIEVIRVSLESLMANRMRSLLTMLGVIIGVASVVALLSLGGGVSDSITNQVQGLGTNLLTIIPTAPGRRGPGSDGAGGASLTVADANAIATLHLPLTGVSPEFDGSGQLVAPAADKNAAIAGVTASYRQDNHLKLASGSFLDDGQVRSAASVVVLGANLATDLYGKGEAVGQVVRVDGKALRVIGVMAAKGGSSFGSVDDRALVPITFAQQQLFNGRTPDGNSYRVSSITLAAIDGTELPGIQSRVEALLRERHHVVADGTGDDFTVIDQKAFLSTLTTITTALTLFLGAIAGISLVVGGIGIMNIMLVSVTERTREIGLRKAVGAQARDIMLQFIVEALAISVLGGLIGLAIGAGIATAVTLSGVFAAPVTLSSVAIAIGFSMAVGLFFGIYPARRAAGLNPIDALRHE